MGCFNCDRDYYDRHRRRDCKFCRPDGYYPGPGYYPPRHRRGYGRDRFDRDRYDRDRFDYERTDNVFLIDPPRFFR